MVARAPQLRGKMGPANQISVKRSVTKRSQSTDGQGERKNDWAGERLPDARQKASSEDNEVK